MQLESLKNEQKVNPHNPGRLSAVNAQGQCDMRELNRGGLLEPVRCQHAGRGHRNPVGSRHAHVRQQRARDHRVHVHLRHVMGRTGASGSYYNGRCGGTARV